MKQIFTLLFCFFYALNISSQTTWAWAKSAGGAQDDGGIASSTDNSGNTYVTGYFASTTIAFGTTTLTNSSAGTTDVFLAKYDTNGNPLWAVSTGSAGSEFATSIATDVSGNIYVAGYFTNSPSGSRDVFLTKFNATGTIIWTKTAAGTMDDFAASITTDATGNIYMTGNFESSTMLFTSITLTNTGVADMFLAKYDTNGNILWAQNAYGNHAEIGSSVAMDGTGSIYVTGYFYSPYSVFGQDTLVNTSVSFPPAFDPNGIDMFLVKYNSSGNVIWAKSMGGSEHEQGKSVTTFGNFVYVGGIFSSSVVTTGSVTLTNTGTNALYDIFLMKYDSNGNPVWGKSAGGTYWDYLHYAKTDIFGNIFVTGQFGAPSMSTGTNTLTNVGDYDIYLLKYDANGFVMTALAVGSQAHENGMSVTTDAIGNAYLTGYTAGSTLTFGASTINGAGNFDMYLAKLAGPTAGVASSTKEKGSFSIHPNPSAGYFSIDVSELSGKNVTLSVFNITGKKIFEKTVSYSETDYFLDLSSEGEGVYFVKVNSEGVSKTTKLVLKR